MNIFINTAMKHLLKTAFTLLLVLSATGCGKGFLDRTPLDQTTEASFYRNEKDAVAAINAAYDVLQFEITGAGHMRWFWGDVVSDDAIKGGSGDNDAASLGDLENFRGKASNELLAAEWAADYQGIYRANLVLENVPGIDMNAALKARMLGEAKFIRAWFYYNLVTIFGDVPLVDHTLAPSEYMMARAPKAEIWALIEQDLTEAAAALPLRSEYAAADLGRITKGAAQGLLARVYLFQGKWADAKAAADAVISSGQYALVADYATIFTEAGENNSESVFEIQFMNASNGDWGRTVEGSFVNVFQRARGAFGGYGFNIPTQDLVDEFEPGDPRLKATLFQVGDVMGDRGTFTLAATGGFPHLYYPKKYFINKSEEAPTGDPNVNGPSNDRVIRYSDVLLMQAEAAYHLGDEATARTAVNQVRARARKGSTTILPDVTASGADLLAAIRHERRVELALEGHRFFDLVRWGVAGETMRAQGLPFTDGVHELFPVPLTQIQATNGKLSQNPGY